MRSLIIACLSVLALLCVMAGDIFVVGTKLVTAPGASPENAIPAEVFCYNEWNNFGGGPECLTNGSGMNGYYYGGPIGDPPYDRPPVWPTNDVSEWYATDNNSQYRDEWQGEAYEDLVGPAWIIVDLGKRRHLNEWYLWNNRDVNTRGIQTFNVYYANNPTVAPVHGPTSNSEVQEYDFDSGGWTLVNTSGVLLLPIGDKNGLSAELVVDMVGVSARYIGIEIITNHGNANRVGLAEMGLTRRRFTKAVTQ